MKMFGFYRYYFLLCLSNLHLVICQTNFRLVKEYINYTQSTSCTFLGDWHIKDLKTFMRASNISYRFWTNQIYLSADQDLDIKNNNMLFILNYHSKGMMDVLYKASTNGDLNYKRKWLILTNFSIHNAHKFLFDKFGNIPFRFDSNIKIATLSSLMESDATFFLYEMYNTGFGKNGTFISNNYSYWSATRNSFFHIGCRNRYREKYVLSGVNLKAGTVIRTPNINDSEIHNYLIQRTPVDWISKFGYSIFAHLVELHNFKFILIKSEMWFGNDSTGLNGGVAKDLYEEVVDVASSMTLMKIRRLGFHDYFNPMYKFSTVFIFRNRGGHCLWQNEFLKPFSTSVWISMFIILLLISISIKAINWTEVNYLKSMRSYSLFSAILITISILCQQGSPILPRYITSRLIFFVVLTLSFILYNYYTSSIVSALLNTKPKELTTFRDLISTGLQLGIQMAPYTLVIFQRNMNEDLQTIRRLIFPEKGKPHVWNLTEGLEKVRIGGSAYHVEAGYAYSIISKTFYPQAICEISDKIALIPPSMLPFWLKKNAPYRNLFKFSLRRMEEVGLVQRSRKIWEKEKPPCLANTILLSVGLDQIFIALFLLVVGYFTSCSIMFLEICYAYYVKKKQHNQ